MGTKYIHASQEDLKIRFDYKEDLTSYTGTIYYYEESEGNANRTGVTAVMSIITSVLAYVQYTFTTGLFSVYNSNYYVYAEITSNAGYMRACAPVVIPVNEKGNIEYSLTD
jgi:hypothetical protein